MHHSFPRNLYVLRCNRPPSDALRHKYEHVGDCSHRSASLCGLISVAVSAISRGRSLGRTMQIQRISLLEYSYSSLRKRSRTRKRWPRMPPGRSTKPGHCVMSGSRGSSQYSSPFRRYTRDPDLMSLRSPRRILSDFRIIGQVSCVSLRGSILIDSTAIDLIRVTFMIVGISEDHA